MSPYLTFRIIGWFIIGIIVLSTMLKILALEKPRKKEPLSAKIVIAKLGINVLTIWFIYTAMQI